MIKAFGIAGLGPEVVEQRFGGLFRAFQYGAPRTAAWLRDSTASSCC